MAEPIDGIMGLARPNEFYLSGYQDAGLVDGPLYLNKMY